MKWRSDPSLSGRFHSSDYPDDLQVLVHDGGPRFTDKKPEEVWVRVTGGDGRIFTGCILNHPVRLKTVHQEQTIRFLAPRDGGRLVMATEKYLLERPHWEISPCDKCGLSEVLDAPSDLVKASFKDLPAGGAFFTFTSFCPICGVDGKLELNSVGAPVMEPKLRRWFDFWK